MILNLQECLEIKRFSSAVAVKKTAVLMVAVVVNVASTQTASAQPATVDLTAPKLRANANLAEHNLRGVSLSESLLNGRALAASKGLRWKGMDHVVSDEAGNLAGFNKVSLLQLYQRNTCQADAIAIGHTDVWAHHLSASGTAVYADYAFVIDTLLKDNPTSSIQSRPVIVLTRPGGSLVLPEGPVTFDFQAFPHLQTGITYLQFLRYIPESSSYQALNSFSTLVATGHIWAIARKAFSGLVFPEFTRGAFEGSISNWLTSCR